MKISERTYSDWQKKLHSLNFFSIFWKFWGMYGVVFYMLAGLLLIFLYEEKFVPATAFLSFVLARGIVAEAIYFFVKRSRPHQVYKFSQPKSWLFSWGTKRPDSFPSGHAISSAAISSVFFLYNPTLGVVSFAVALMVGIGRVVLGYHYASDVLGGWFLGTLVGLGSYFYLAERLFTHF